MTTDIAPIGNPAEAAPSEANTESADHTIIYGRSCLAGDIFGEYALPSNLQIGDKIAFGNAAGYTMVKKNWFNGVWSSNCFYVMPPLPDFSSSSLLF